MRAAVLTEFNKDWQIQTLPDPRPAPGQVLIRIHASGMCGTDLHAHHGHLGAKLPSCSGTSRPARSSSWAPACWT